MDSSSTDTESVAESIETEDEMAQVVSSAQADDASSLQVSPAQSGPPDHNTTGGGTAPPEHQPDTSTETKHDMESHRMVGGDLSVLWEDGKANPDEPNASLSVLPGFE